MPDLMRYSTTKATSLSSAMTSGDTSVPLVDGSTYPDPAVPGNGPYTVLIGYGSDREEICTVTAKPSTNELTVTRAQDGSSAVAKNIGDVVVHGVSKRDWNDMLDTSVGGTMAGDLILAGDPTSDLMAATKGYVDDADALKADLASPALTGTPTAPTASPGTNTTQIATTAFVNSEIANDAPSKTGTGASGTWGISITGNAATATDAATATSLKTTRSISLTGDVTGSANFNGSADAAITATVADDSHSHTNYETTSNNDRRDPVSDLNIQSGTVSVAGDDTSQRNQAVTFATPFTSTPVVILQELTGMTSSSTTQSCWPQNVTTTGFTVSLVRNNNTTVSVRWMAFGPTA